MTSATPTLLYIDDDEALARLVDRGLTRAGFKVVHAAGGDQGLARLAQGGIDAVALDQYMPGLDVQETLERIMAIPDTPPMVFRTAAVAQVHRRLYTSHDLKSVLLNQYLEALLEDLRRSAEGNKMSRLTLKAEPIEIDPDRAVAIGIIVNELVMNAVKYAYPDGAGPIHVELKAAGDNLELAIADDGVGLNVKADPRSTGMGQRIVSAMASKLEASVERDPAHSGTKIALQFRRVSATVPKPNAAAK